MLKTRRIASSLALAGALALGLSSCGLMVEQGTTHPYAPSDGIDVTVDDLAVRNLMLVADSSGEKFNVVFAGINGTDSDLRVKFTFEGTSGSESVDFTVEPGSTLFGNPDGDEEPKLVTLKGVNPGDAVTAYIELAGGAKDERQVPVLDGTLKEYKDYVL